MYGISSLYSIRRLSHWSFRHIEQDSLIFHILDVLNRIV